jgi:hypothetical protein
VVAFTLARIGCVLSGGLFISAIKKNTAASAPE